MVPGQEDDSEKLNAEIVDLERQNGELHNQIKSMMHDHAELIKRERLERDDELASLQLENETLKNELEAGDVSFRE